jgi:antitoxin ParD1/3/4
MTVRAGIAIHDEAKSMSRIEVTLPDSAKQYVEAQVASGQFASPSEYLGFLVEQARAEASKRRLDDMLEEGLSSGPPTPFSETWWRERKASLLATLPEEPVE